MDWICAAFGLHVQLKQISRLQGYAAHVSSLNECFALPAGEQIFESKNLPCRFVTKYQHQRGLNRSNADRYVISIEISHKTLTWFPGGIVILTPAKQYRASVKFIHSLYDPNHAKLPSRNPLWGLPIPSMSKQIKLHWFVKYQVLK